MALDVRTGTFQMNTTTGNQAVTGVGFQPKIVLFFPAGENTASGITNDLRAGFGVGISSSARRSIDTNSQTASAAGANVRSQTNTSCIRVFTDNSTTVVLYAADFVSLDSDGFTINVTTAPASGFRVGYLALGGADLTNVATGQFQSATATGNQAVTGTGFQPDTILLFGINSATAPPNAATNTRYGFGMARSSTQRGAMDFSADVSADPSNTSRVQRTDRALTTGNGSAQYDLVSMDANGFTLNVNPAPGAGLYIHYVALKGGQFAVGNFNTATTTGNFGVTGTGFQPKAVLFTSFLNASSATAVDDAKYSVGVATSSTERFAVGGYDQDNQATTNSRHWLATDKMYKNYNTSATNIEDIDLVSMDSNGFTLNQTTTDGTARQVNYLAIGDSPAVVAQRTFITYRHPWQS